MIEKNALEVNLRNAVCIWWAFVWRATLFTFIVSIVIGFVAGVVLGVAGKSEHARIVGTLVGYLVSIPISVLVFRHILEKRYKNFRIVLVPNKTVEVELPGDVS